MEGDEEDVSGQVKVIDPTLSPVKFMHNNYCQVELPKCK